MPAYRLERRTTGKATLETPNEAERRVATSQTNNNNNNNTANNALGGLYYEDEAVGAFAISRRGRGHQASSARLSRHASWDPTHQLVEPTPPEPRESINPSIRANDVDVAVCELVNNHQSERSLFGPKPNANKKWCWIIFVGLGVVALAIGITLGILLLSDGDNVVQTSDSDVADEGEEEDSSDAEKPACTGIFFENGDSVPVSHRADLNLTSNRQPCTAADRARWFMWQDKDSERRPLTSIKNRFALATLYYSTNGPSWVGNDLWMTEEKECDWVGVTCREGKVVIISLPSQGLEGTIPTELFGLTSLEVLELDLNRLKGTIPSEMYGLTALVRLDLQSNSLSGTISSELGKWTNLKELQLKNNEFQGQLPSEFGLLTSLTSLQLQSNMWTGSIPDVFWNIRFLRELWLGDASQISSSFPSSLSRLTLLKTLSISTSAFHSSIPTTIGYLTELTNLQLTNNAITGTLPSELGSLEHLERLAIALQAELTGPIPTQIGRLTGLNTIDFSKTALTGELPLGLCPLFECTMRDPLRSSHLQLSETGVVINC